MRLKSSCGTISPGIQSPSTASFLFNEQTMLELGTSNSLDGSVHNGRLCTLSRGDSLWAHQIHTKREGRRPLSNARSGQDSLAERVSGLRAIVTVSGRLIVKRRTDGQTCRVITAGYQVCRR